MSALESVKNGRQVGMDIDFDYEGVPHRLLLAIQEYKGDFISYITLIDEENIAGEDYTIYKVTAHTSIDRAVAFLKEKSPAAFNFEDFKPFKGQKVFYPEGEEIEREGE